jgi:predicted CXXCH cytochrome family protein
MHPTLLNTCLILVMTLAMTPAAGGEELRRPVGNWFGTDHEKCVSCHEPGTAGADEGPGAETCLGCHADIGRSSTDSAMPASYQDDFVSGHVMAKEMYSPRLPQGGHRVQESLDCLSCHDPHGGDGKTTTLRDKQGPAVLSALGTVDEVSRFCVGCHEDMSRFGGMAQAYSRHPIGLTADVVQRSYLPVLPLADVHGTADPSDDVVACTTCHFVHNGPNQYLLRWDRSIEGHVCGQCHVQGRTPDGLGDRRRIARLR